jgi:type IV secretion system protein VirB5
MNTLKRFIFGDKTGKPATVGSAPLNPYIAGSEGRREWDDRYRNMAKAIKNWQVAFMAAIGVAIVLSLVVARIATESRIEPFVVETNKGMPYAIVKPVAAMSAEDPRLVNYAINQFVINAKTIVNDTDAERSLLNKAYAFSADNTIGFLHEYYQKNNPFTLAAQTTVSVAIVNAMAISRNIWQVTWDETARDPAGNVIKVSRWMGNFTYRFGDPDPQFMTDNPFGLYISQATWAESR